MKTTEVPAATIAACPARRLDAAHYLTGRSGGNCLCAGLAREERLAQIAELEARNTAMRTRLAENDATIAQLRDGL